MLAVANECFTNHDMLVKAASDADWHVRLAAVAKIDDDLVPERICLNDGKGIVRDFAKMRLEGNGG